MKTFVVLAVSVGLMSILFCPMVMAAPPMPADLQIVQPDPSLPKELSAFFGKWEGRGKMNYFLIVEKIDEEKASLYVWEFAPESSAPIWVRYEAQVIKEGGKYKLWYTGRFGKPTLMLKGEVLNWSTSSYTGSESVRLNRAP
jgi:hypothetical protein